mgnify:CR=1 FL=1
MARVVRGGGRDEPGVRLEQPGAVRLDDRADHGDAARSPDAVAESDGVVDGSEVVDAGELHVGLPRLCGLIVEQNKDSLGTSPRERQYRDLLLRWESIKEIRAAS